MAQHILLKERQNIKDQLHDLQESGYAYIPNALTDNEIKELRDKLEGLTGRRQPNVPKWPV
jgi:hypothetical protein